MATKIIKFNDGSTTYVPVTLASAVQYSYDGGVMSVQQALGTVAQAVIENTVPVVETLNDHIDGKVNLSYSTANGIYPTGIHGTGTGVKINAGTGINITNSGTTLTISNSSTNQTQYFDANGATNPTLRLDGGTNGSVQIKGTTAAEAGQATVTVSYTAANGITIKATYTDTNTKQTIATNNTNQYWITGVAAKTGDQTGAVDGTAYFKAGTLYETTIAATNMYKDGKSVATEEYVNSKLTGLIDFKGNWPSTAPTTIEQYDAWRITTDTNNWNGTTHNVEAGDIVLALTNNPGTTTANWTVIQNNIDVSGLVRTISGSGDTEVSITPTSATGPDANGNVALTVSHAPHNVGDVTASGKNVTGSSGQQKVITGITVNSFGHVTGYTAANIYSTDSKSVISGEYRTASSTAYVKLTNNTGEVGIYNAGAASDAGVTLSYTSGKGIGIKVTYTDTNTHVGTHTLSASGTTNPTISLGGTDSSGSVQFKAGTLTSVSYSAANGIQVNHTTPGNGSVTATATKTIDIAKDDYGHVTAINRVDIATMGAATASAAGSKGFVPAPPANSLNKVLTGAATFKTISASQGNHTAGLKYVTMDTTDNFTLFDDSEWSAETSLATIASPAITVSLS